MQTLPDTLLSAAFTGVLSADYLRTDVPISGPQNIRQNIRYADLKTLFTNGDGNYKANLLFENRYSLPGHTTQIINLNGGILNRWDQPLNFNAVHMLVVHNRSDIDLGTTIEFTFKNEVYSIGPQGSRVIIEPSTPGINVFGAISATSHSSEEGHITITTAEDACEVDLIIIGSRYEESSSSGI